MTLNVKEPMRLGVEGVNGKGKMYFPGAEAKGEVG